VKIVGTLEDRVESLEARLPYIAICPAKPEEPKEEQKQSKEKDETEEQKQSKEKDNANEEQKQSKEKDDDNEDIDLFGSDSEASEQRQ